MTTHDLAKLLLTRPDKNVSVSIDVSSSDHNSEQRAFGEVIELQESGNDETTILCIGALNFN